MLTARENVLYRILVGDDDIPASGDDIALDARFQLDVLPESDIIAADIPVGDHISRDVEPVVRAVDRLCRRRYGQKLRDRQQAQEDPVFFIVPPFASYSSLVFGIRRQI